MSAGEGGVASSFEEYLGSKNTSSLTIEAGLGAMLIPLFWVLDWYVVPDHVWNLFAIRLVPTLIALGLLGACFYQRSWVVRHVDALTIGFTLTVAWSIAIMNWLHLGLESPYYAGIGLLVVSVGLLFAWPPRKTVFFFSVVYGFYVLPFVLGLMPIQELSVALSNQFFLLSMIVVSGVWQLFRYRLEHREFESRREIERSRRSLEEAYNQLKEIDRLKSDFFSNITHELRTPLTMILAPVDSLLAGDMWEVDEKQRAYLEPIRRNGLRLLRLINDLLDLSRIEERFLRLGLRETDLEELVGDTVQHARGLAARKAIDIELDTKGFDDERLFVDPEQIERVIINLLSNALKFTPEGGTVSVSIDRGAAGVDVSVTDNGIGMNTDEVEAVFERFRQADGSVTRQYGGSGIGLSLVKEIVDLHGGKVDVSSRKGAGSTFTIHLPRDREHLSSGEQVAASPQDEGTREPREWTRQLVSGRDYKFLEIDEATDRRVARRIYNGPGATKVLVVEDNVDVLRFLHMQLQDEHNVYLAKDGKKGLELALRECPEVIVTDYMMPHMDGVSMVRALKDEPSTADIPIIMLTAKNRVEDRLEAREAGADVYLGKPFSARELRSAVKQLRKKRGRQTTLMMREHVQSLEVISAGLAHEINNPLFRIRNAMGVIEEKIGFMNRAVEKDGGVADEKSEQLRRARARIERMRQVANAGIDRIGEIVELVRRYAREGYPTEPVPLRLDDMVRDVSRLVVPMDSNEVVVDLELGAGAARVLCIPEELQQAIKNLWQNALDAVGDEGRILVETGAADGWVTLMVSDDGPGVPRDVLPRLFTPFFTTKGGEGGLGLGLAITHQVVTRANGEITVQSSEGGGTTMRVMLPEAPVESQGRW